MKIPDPSILDAFTMDPETGLFYWKIISEHARGISIGDAAGSISKAGYRILWFKGKHYQAHRVAWYFYYGEWPVEDIDHRDLDKLNNRKANLRQASDSQNLANTAAHKNNKVGLKGVSPSGSKFRAQIKKNGTVIYLGQHSTPEAAHAAYVTAARQLHGDFARVA